MGRGWGPPFAGGVASFFLGLNRGKHGISIDLKQREGLDLCLRLIDRMDVLIENFRPGAMDRLGLGYKPVHRRNPRLVYCSISGYGQSGPYRDKPGFDTIGQALSGMLSLVTDFDNPKVAGFSITDHSAGIFAAHGIMAALLARQKTGRGQFVDVSLLQVSLAFIESHVADYLNGGEAVSRDNFPRGRIYCVICSDNKPLVIHLSGHQHAWEGLLKVIGRTDLLHDSRGADRRSRTEHHYELLAILREEFRKKPRTHWLAALDAENLPNAPINTIQEVFEDPQIKHMGIPKKIHHPRMGTSNLVGSPINLSGTPPHFFRPAPLLGENTDEILARFGYDAKAIADLRAEGVI
jgi:crotonobetainyl-CoA:carnitine CoA-transferase CaiB-like acyl-CoA transferase